jgi:hypothetical protein
MDRLHRFVNECLFANECLSHLEGKTDAVPPIDGMTPQERDRARRWLRDLGHTRDVLDLVQAVKDRERGR